MCEYKEYINSKKVELGLDNMSDKEIIKYSLQCSYDIKRMLDHGKQQNIYDKSLKITLSNADALILKYILSEDI